VSMIERREECDGLTLRRGWAGRGAGPIWMASRATAC
jgi:hypothetical protein